MCSPTRGRRDSGAFFLDRPRTREISMMPAAPCPAGPWLYVLSCEAVALVSGGFATYS
jgi:hypothetical protein